MGIIDIHVHHLWNDPDNRPSESIEFTKSYARRWGIDRVLLLTLAIGQPPERVRERNSCTLRLMQEHPQFFLGGFWLNPLHDIGFIKEEGSRCFEAGMVAIKLHASLNARDHRHDVIAEMAAEFDIPILFHTWYNNTGNAENESNCSDIAYLARRHPETKIIMAHLPGARRRGVVDVADLPNVWIDTCGGWPESEIVEYAVRHLGAGRLIYGSDWVGANWTGRDFGPQLGRVLGAHISDDDKQKILWKNAYSLLKLEQRARPEKPKEAI